MTNSETIAMLRKDELWRYRHENPEYRAWRIKAIEYRRFANKTARRLGFKNYADWNPEPEGETQ